MAKVSLRSYNTEIDRLIDNNQLDEAIAHCIHILGIYPKHVDTYRLLGKAFLERQRYKDAADMFLRVLAIFPDDFVAHIGISIVREELADLNLAVFHMERAFEVQPTNTAIQDELKRLYGKRDGVAPAKIRLTHPALARLYSKGELNQQALGELSVAIADTPSRADILTQLAELYTKEGQNNEAIETCNKLIEQLPYCYGALNVLTRLLPGTPFAQDAPIYQARINELDPYFEFKSSINEPASDVQEDAIMLETLVWSPDSELSVNKSDWISSLGLKLVEPAQVDPVLFQKKAPVASYTQDETPTVPRIRQSAAQFASTPETSDINVPVVQSSSESTPAADIPEWMESAGWSKSNDSEGTSGVSSPSEVTPSMPSVENIRRDTDNLPPLKRDTDHLPPLTANATGNDTGDIGALEPAKTIEPGSIPDWVRSIAPSDLTTSKSGTSPGIEGISDKAINDAFSSIFPSTTQPQENPQPEIPETPTDTDHNEPAPQEPVPEIVSVSEEKSPSPTMDEENAFSLDDLRKEMDMVPDLTANSEAPAPLNDNMVEPSDNGTALDNLRKSFSSEGLHLGGASMPEDDLINNDSASPQEPSDAIRPAEDVNPEDVTAPLKTRPEPAIVSQEEAPVEEVSLTQEEAPVEKVSMPQEAEQPVPVIAAEPTKAPEGEIPVWLRTLGDGQTSAEAQPAQGTPEDLPAWLQDFEHKIEDQQESPAEAVNAESTTAGTPAEPAAPIDWRLNLPPKSESKFHTQELPEIPGLDLTETPDQFEIEEPTKNVEATAEKQPEPSPVDSTDQKAVPATPVFSGGETTVIAPPISQAEPVEDERPAWLSKLIGIDDIEAPSSVKGEKTSESATPAKPPENMDEIAGAMQAAWMMDLLSDKKPEAETAPESKLSREEIPDSTLQKEVPTEPEPSPVVPESEAIIPPAVEPEVSAIDKMFEGIQAGFTQKPIEPEPVPTEIPTVPESTSQGETDLGTLIDSLRSEPLATPEESMPSTPAPAITSEALVEDNTDLNKLLEDLHTDTAPATVEPAQVPPAVEAIPEPSAEPFFERLEDIPDLIKMVDDLKAGPASTPSTPEPVKPVPFTPPATPITSPAAPPADEVGSSEGVPDLGMIVEGLQAAWMSEHGEDGEVKHTGKLHDIYVPPPESGGSETIVIKRPGPAPVESQPESYQPVAEPMPPEAESIEPGFQPESEQAVNQPEPIPTVVKREKPDSQVSHTKPQPSAHIDKSSSVSDKIPAEEILQDARAAFSHGVLNESLDRYVELIARNRLIDSVIEDLESMTVAQGDQSDVWQALGDAYSRRNQLDQALSAYSKAEELLA